VVVVGAVGFADAAWSHLALSWTSLRPPGVTTKREDDGTTPPQELTQNGALPKRAYVGTFW
jgi:hypothetical protein